MKDCTNCKWDRLNSEGRMIQCFQGHVRIFKKMVENCHAWEERPKEIYCNLKDPEIECFEFKRKMDHGWCKDCVHRGLEERPNPPCWCDEPTFCYVLAGEKTIKAEFCPVCQKPREEWGK